MESIWIITLYIIFPIVGFLILLFGVIRYRKTKSKALIFPGLIFLTASLTHLLIMSQQNNNLENKLIGKYKYGNLNDVLEIYESGKFELKEGNLYTINGSGSWKIETIDFPILILNFEENHNEKWLEINSKNDDDVSLSSYGSDTTFTFEFEKNKYSR